MNAQPGQIVDHIDRDKLNCQRANLRFTTKQQNTVNSGMWSNNTSGIKGVYWDKARNKWHAQIKVNQKTIGLGRFDTLELATTVRDNAARHYFGHFATTNASLGLI